MKTKKHLRFLSVIMAALMVLSVFSAVPFTAAETDKLMTGTISSGTTGGAKWTLSDSGVLTITGNNVKMGEYETETTITGTPWKDWADQITSVVVEKGVNNVGARAFKGLSNLKTATIKGAETIGLNAFKDCSSLTSAYLNKGLTEIGKSAFYNCTSLSYVNIPSTVTAIGSDAFYDCTSLKNVSLPDSLKKIGATAFDHCPLTSIDLPEGLEIVGQFAFENTSLTQVYVPNSVTSVGEKAFGFTYSYKEGSKPVAGFVVYSASDAVKKYCTEESLTCKSIVSDKDKNGIEYYLNLNDHNLHVTGSGETEQYSNHLQRAWYICRSNINQVTFGKGISSIGANLLYDCKYLTNVLMTDDIEYIYYGAFSRCTSLKTFTCPLNLKYIGKLAFYLDTSLETINLNDKVFQIGESAFEGTPMKTAFIPRSVTTIGDNAFGFDEEGDMRTDFKVETDWNTYAAKWAQPENGSYYFPVVYISDSGTTGSCTYTMDFSTGVFKLSGTATEDFTASNGKNPSPWNGYLNKITDIQIEDGVEKIGSFAFCAAPVESITTPKSVKEIGEYAFAFCRNVNKGITINGNDCKIANDAFNETGTTDNTFIRLSGVESIGNDAFYECDSAIIELGNVKTIGASAFSINEEVTKLIIGKDCEEIGAYAFGGAEKLKKVTILNPSVTIGDGAFPKTPAIAAVSPSTAETFAKENGNEFIDISAPEETTVPPTTSYPEETTFEPTTSPYEPTEEPTTTSPYEPTEEPSNPEPATEPEETTAPATTNPEETTEPSDTKPQKPTEPQDTKPTEPAETNPTEQPTEQPTVQPTEQPTVQPATEAPKPTVAPASGKKTNPIKITAKKKTVKLKNLKKKNQTVKALTVKNAKGSLTYKLVKKGSTAKLFKYLKISNKGVITIKRWKKAKKGEYKINISITAKGNSKFKKKTKKITLKLKIS